MDNKTVQFMVSADADLYTSYGVAQARQIFEALNSSDSKNKNFNIACFGPRTTGISKPILEMKEISFIDPVKINFSNIDTKGGFLLVHPAQTFIDAAGNPISVDELNPGMTLVSVNGYMTVVSVEICDQLIENDFYLITMDKDSSAIYVNTFILLPLGETELPFC